MSDTHNSQPAYDRMEHEDTNHAKHVDNWNWNGTAWSKASSPNAGFITSPYDYVSVAYPDTTTEVYTFKLGGSGGTTVNTVTITYTDDTKVSLNTVARA